MDVSCLKKDESRFMLKYTDHFDNESDYARSTDARSGTSHEWMSPFRNIGELLQHQVESHSEKMWIAFHAEDGSMQEGSYAAFLQDVRVCVRLLLARGLRRGDRICTVAHNHYDTVVQYFAAWSIGVAVVPVNVGEDDQRIAFIMADSSVRLAFVRGEYISRIKPLIEGQCLAIEIVEVGSSSYESDASVEELGHASLVCMATVTPDDEALIIYTSGTTGRPKGVVLDQGNLLTDAHAIAGWHHIQPQDRMMCVLPIHHVNGIVVTLLTPMIAGSSVVLMQRFHAHEFFSMARRYEVAIASVVPTLLQYLVHQQDLASHSVHEKFKHVICGAGPLTCDLVQSFEGKFGLSVIHGYGLSETTCYSCFLPVNLPKGEHEAWLLNHGFPSIGVPLTVNDMEIHDEQGVPLSSGVRGEIVIRGRNVMRYYYKNPEANAAAFTNGWFRSGDEGFHLEDSRGQRYFFITGRFKELIIRGGVNISPLEVDEVLSACDGVQAAIAVGFENDWYGEEVGALVIRRRGDVTEEDVLTHCRNNLPYSKSPKKVLFVDELPVTSTGKYQRNRVKHLFEEWRSVQFR
jgi:acyl-CoA synthetase (AMP-forming)/AMP-acid ligase II